MIKLWHGFPAKLLMSSSANLNCVHRLAMSLFVIFLESFHFQETKQKGFYSLLKSTQHLLIFNFFETNELL